MSSRSIDSRRSLHATVPISSRRSSLPRKSRKENGWEGTHGVGPPGSRRRKRFSRLCPFPGPWSGWISGSSTGKTPSPASISGSTTFPIPLRICLGFFTFRSPIPEVWPPRWPSGKRPADPPALSCCSRRLGPPGECCGLPLRLPCRPGAPTPRGNAGRRCCIGGGFVLPLNPCAHSSAG